MTDSDKLRRALELQAIRLAEVWHDNKHGKYKDKSEGQRLREAAFVDGGAPYREMIVSLVETLTFIRDLPGLAGMDFTSQKKYSEHVMKLTSKTCSDALDKLKNSVGLE